MIAVIWEKSGNGGTFSPLWLINLESSEVPAECQNRETD